MFQVSALEKRGMVGRYYYFILSYDVAIIQWITSCHKNRMTTRYITLGYWRVTHDAVGDNIMFSIEIISTFKAIKPHLKGHMINRILHSWLFHMKFMKLAEGSFHKFHMK